MRALHLLSAVLAIQVQALALGAPVAAEARATEIALCRHMDSLLAPTPPPEPEPALPPDEAAEAADEATPSAWDPEPQEALLEASRCRALFLEVIRRAAHDWVLYRNTRRLERAFAEHAYTWLFEEEPASPGRPAHPWWKERQESGEPLLSFLSICETLDLEPETVRARVRAMTIRDIITAGRPAECRRSRKERHGIEDFESPPELDMVSLDDPNFDSSYEAYFAVG